MRYVYLAHIRRKILICIPVTPSRSISIPPQHLSEPVIKGCARLPELTLFWPYNLYPPNICATILDNIQTSLEVPWWAALAIGGCTAKITMYSFNIYNLRKMQQFFRTTPKQTAGFILTYLNNLVTKGQGHAFTMAKNERRYIVYRYGAHSLRLSMLSTFFTYIPVMWLAGIHISMLSGILYLNQIQYLPLLIGGPSWAQNLTVVDPYYILPSLCMATGVLSIYRHPIRWLLPLPTPKFRHLAYATPFLPFIFGGLSGLPADILIYMIFANITAVNLNSLLSFPSVYREFGLLSNSETLNRMIPQKHVFMELGRSLDRQFLLSEQKKQQLLEAQSNETESFEPSSGPKFRITDGDASVPDNNSDLEPNKKVEPANVDEFAKVNGIAANVNKKKLNADDIAQNVYRIEKRFAEKS